MSFTYFLVCFLSVYCSILLFLSGFGFVNHSMVVVEDHLTGLSLEDVEEEEICSLDAKGVVGDSSLDNCFVGFFLTISVVHFQSMRATLANVWHPIGDITITDLSEGRFLFCLYHKVDADQKEIGGPWNFNSHLLIMYRLCNGEDLRTVPLNMVDFWVMV